MNTEYDCPYVTEKEAGSKRKEHAITVRDRAEVTPRRQEASSRVQPTQQIVSGYERQPWLKALRSDDFPNCSHGSESSMKSQASRALFLASAVTSATRSKTCDLLTPASSHMSPRSRVSCIMETHAFSPGAGLRRTTVCHQPWKRTSDRLQEGNPEQGQSLCVKGAVRKGRRSARPLSPPSCVPVDPIPSQASAGQLHRVARTPGQGWSSMPDIRTFPLSLLWKSSGLLRVRKDGRDRSTLDS